MDARHSYYLIPKPAIGGLQELREAMQESTAEIIARSCRRTLFDDAIGPAVRDFSRNHGILVHGVDAEDPDTS